MVLFGLNAQAQFAQIEISTPDKQAFFTALNDSLVSDKSTNKQLVSPVSIGAQTIWIILDPGFVSQQFKIAVTEEKRYVFELSNSDSILTLLPVSVSALDTASHLPPPAPKKKPLKKGQKPPKEPKPEPVIGRRLPGITLDGLLLRGQMENYGGKLGCSGALGDVAFRKSSQEIATKDFESERLIIVKGIIQNNCISVNQLAKLLEFFEFDDTKLSLVNESKKHILDVDNLNKLEEKFTFSNSKEKLKAVIEGF